MNSITKDLENLALKSSEADNNNNNNNAIDGKWRRWRYECHDLRMHDDKAYTTDVNKQYNAKMRQIRAEREANGIPVIEESQDRWHLCLTKDEDVLYESMDVMLKALEEVVQEGGQFSCGALARKTYFDKMHGFGFFRDGFMPSYQDDLGGDIYQVQLLGFAGDHQLLAKFDQLFIKTMHWVKELPEELAKCVHGVMLRSEINPGTKLTKVVEPYGDKANLPCRFKLDVWITKKSDELDLALIEKIKAELKQTLDIGNQVLPKYKSERFKHAKANAADKNYNRYWRK